MNNIHTVSDNLNLILYADDRSSAMYSFTRVCNGNIELISTLINSELNKIANWLAINKLSLNIKKKQIHDYRQRVITENRYQLQCSYHTCWNVCSDINCYVCFNNDEAYPLFEAGGYGGYFVVAGCAFVIHTMTNIGATGDRWSAGFFCFWKCDSHNTPEFQLSSHLHWVTRLLFVTELTHWGRDKWPPFSRRHFQMHFLEWKCINFD